MYKVVQIWPGLVRLVYTQISPGHIWTTLYLTEHPSVLAFTNILYSVLLLLIPKFANECAIEVYIRSMPGVTKWKLCKVMCCTLYCECSEKIQLCVF
jgi:hypothetical protein